MESFVLHDIELTTVNCSSPFNRSLSIADDNLCFDQLDTKLGQMYIYRQGCEFNKLRPILITYHDIGLNSTSNFQAFFNFSDMKLMLQSISVIHLNAIGQEDNAPNYPASLQYPSLDDLADQILEVCDRYKIKNFIGFGVGVGANILSRFALKNPKFVDGLVLINPTASRSTWTEWIYQKINVYYLSSVLTNSFGALNNSFPANVRDYLMWHHFGYLDETKNYDLIGLFKKHFEGKTINAYNLSLFIDSYIKRTDLGIGRKALDKNFNPVKNDESDKNFKCPILLIVGALSPHIEDSVNMNSRIDPSNTTWLKLADSGMVLEEQPGKVAEALKLFIQGLGYAMTNYDKQKTIIKNNMDNYDYLNITNNKNLINDKYNSGDKLNQNDKISFEPTKKDGHFIIENPIEHC